MNFYFCSAVVLLTLSYSQTYNVTGGTIDIQTVSTVTIDDNGNAVCKEMISSNHELYHVGTTQRYENYPKGALDPDSDKKDFGGGGKVVQTFGVDPTQSLLIVITDDTSNNVDTFTIDPVDFQISGAQTFTIPAPFPSFVGIKGTTIYTFTKDIGSSNSKITEMNQFGFVQNTYLFVTIYTNMVMSPDSTKAILWTEAGEVVIKNTSDLHNNLNTWTSTTLLPNGVLNTITFSQDSSFAIIETDNYNPLVVINLDTFQITHSIIISDTIYKASFLDSSNNILVVFGLSNFTVVELSSLTKYEMSPIASLVYDVDQQGNIFTCTGTIIEQSFVNVTILAPSPEPEPTIDETEFYVPLHSGVTSEVSLEAINGSLAVTSKITNTVSITASSLPISIFFLGFLNFFSMSSYYVLLNVKIPEELYRYLSFIYRQLGSNILSLLGLEVSIPELSEQKVNSNRGIFFQVSSKVQSNLSAFIFLIANIAFIIGLKQLTSCLGRNNFLRRLMVQNKWEMIYGNIINIMGPIILPWTFVIMSMGIRNFKSRINTACYLVIFYIGLLFPFYYFFQLLGERERLLIRLREDEEKRLKADKSDIKVKKEGSAPKQKTENNKSPSYLQKYKGETLKFQDNLESVHEQWPKYKYTLVIPGKPDQVFYPYGKPEKYINPSQKLKLKQPQPHPQPQPQPQPQHKTSSKKISLSDLITGEICQKWHLAQANFLIPAFVMLPNPVLFLVVIFFFLLLGVVVAFKKKQQRVSSFILALYPFIFHLCFMVFYWSSSVNVLIVTQLIALGTFLIGSLHHILFLLYQIVSFIIKMVRQSCKKGQVEPLKSKPEGIKKNQKKKNKKSQENKDKKNQKNNNKTNKGNKNKKSKEKQRVIDKSKASQKKQMTDEKARGKVKKSRFKQDFESRAEKRMKVAFKD